MKKAPVAVCILIAVATILSAAAVLRFEGGSRTRAVTAQMAGTSIELAKVICVKKTEFPNARFNTYSRGESGPAVNCTKSAI